MSRGAVVAVACAAFVPSAAEAATFAVTNTDDAGAGSLRAAITSANAAPGTDTVAITATGTIRLQSALPTITTPMTIDGPGASSLAVERDTSRPEFRIFDIAGTATAVTIREMTIAKGAAPADEFGPGRGGGIDSDAALTVEDAVVSGNVVVAAGIGYGGGIAVAASSTIRRSRVTGNSVHAPSAWGHGGGVFADENTVLTVQASTIDHNVATGGQASFGGGIYTLGGGTVSRSTLFANDAGSGGAAAYVEFGTLAVVNSTIAASGGPGSALLASPGYQLTVRSTIVADGRDGAPACFGVTSLGHNLLEGTGCAATATDRTGVDPALGPLAANGGPTPTLAILASSPAIDRGVVVDAAVDQRGSARPVDGAVYANAAGGDGTDIGAYEQQDVAAPQTTFTQTPPNPQSGEVSHFSISASEPGSTFECRINMGGWFRCGELTFIDILGEGQHRFDARATDAPGNVDPTPATYTWKIDRPPNTTITRTPPALSASAVGAFTFTSDQPGGSFRCKLDSQPAGPCSSPYTTPALGDGEHTLTVTARDAGGKDDATPASFTWRIDTTGPETSITAGPSGETAATSAAFAFTSPEPDATFVCTVDGGAASPCTSPLELSGLAPGTHTVSVAAVDPLGNADASPAEQAWAVLTPAGPPTPSPTLTPTPTPTPAPAVDGAAPNTRITKGPKATKSRRPRFSFRATEAGARFRCKLDKGRYRPCRSGAKLPRLARGRHVLRVVAVDAAGNVDRTPAVKRFRVRR